MLTLGILAGIVVRKLPYNARNAERALSIRTGLDWDIEQVEYRSPTSVRLKKVRLRNFRSDEPIFQADRIDVSFESSNRLNELFPEIDTETAGPSAETQKNSVALLKEIRSLAGQKDGFWRIDIPESTVRLDLFSSEESVQVVQDFFFKLLSRLTGMSESPVRFAFETIDIHSPYSKAKEDARADRIRFVAGNLYRTRLAFLSDWSFQVPSISETETQRFSVAHARRENTFELRFSSGKQPIPCELASVFCSTFSAFGSGSRFSGTIFSQYRAGRQSPWTIHLHNAFLNNLDAAPFAESYTPFAVTGTVKGIRIERATFGAGTMTAEGWLDIVDGSLERVLFNRLVDRFDLHVVPGEIMEAPYGSIPFDRCLLGFRFQPEGAVFFSDQKDNLLFMVRYGDGLQTQPMAVCFSSDRRQPVTYHEIMSALAPDTAPSFPLTPGSQRILSMFPPDSFTPPDRVPDKAAPEDHGPREVYANTPSNAAMLLDEARKRFAHSEPGPVPADSGPVVADPFAPQPNSPGIGPINAPIPAASPNATIPEATPEPPAGAVPSGARIFNQSGITIHRPNP